MKKKGLIISTVVMVVVLLASLTTATYAWFSSSAEARVSQIGMTATAAEGILLGVRKDTTNDTTATRNDFVNGDVSWTASTTANKTLTDGTWAGTTGFGSLLTPTVGDNALNLNVSKAMTKNDATPNAGLENALFKKAPAGDNDSTPGTFEAATANVDYIQLNLGLIASTNKTIDQIIGKIKVTPTDEEQIGMAAAVHFEIAIKGPKASDTWTTLTEIDAYGGREAGYSNFTGTGDDADANFEGKLVVADHKSWTYDFEVWKAASVADTLATGTSLEVVQVKILAWIEGTDDSCTTSYTGTGAQIDISFDYSAISTGDFTVTSGVATRGDAPKQVTFDTGVGSDATIAPQYVAAGGKVTLPAAPTAKTGYTFKGWSTNGTEGGLIASGTVDYTVNENITLTAIWDGPTGA